MAAEDGRVIFAATKGSHTAIPGQLAEALTVFVRAQVFRSRKIVDDMLAEAIR